MNRARAILLAFALAAASLPSFAPALAHEGHHHTAMGTVETVAAGELDLQLQDGKVESFALTAATTYKRAGVAASREEVEVGERAVVIYELKDGRNLAIEVKLGAKKAAEQPSARPGESAGDERR